jgi:hypothetical protein
MDTASDNESFAQQMEAQPAQQRDRWAIRGEGKLMNCWEYLECGREPGGVNAAERGVCLAALAEQHDGINGGVNGGRHCWRIAGTICEGSMEGTAASRLSHCAHCNFFHVVLEEMREDYQV